ncbi:MAG: NAD(P)/FAD-dependent oxidoreductase [bacterium]
MAVPLSNIAIIGAGLAGASLASRLSKAGVEVLLFHSGTVEKHCGGGLPARALNELAWLNELISPRKEIRRITLISPSGIPHDLELTNPMIIVARAEFDERLRRRAMRSGARLLSERVRSLQRDGYRWKIRTDRSEYDAAFIIGADGATSLVRRTLSERFPPSSLSLCAGYYVPPPDEKRIVIGFTKRRAAYSWIFPRQGLASAGGVAPLAGSSQNALLGELRAWLDGSFPGFKFDYSRPYSALISTYPSRRGTLCGDGWALIGDAAGVADPITREGIYFSIKSAEILASAYLSGHPEGYEKKLASFLTRRQGAASLLNRYLFTPFFTERVVRRARKNGYAGRAMENYFSGSLDYGRLGREIISSLIKGKRG